MAIIDSSIDIERPPSLPMSPTAQSIIARLERLPGNTMQVRARVLVGLATFFDGFDVIAIAATLPVLIQKWNLSPWDLGLLIAAGSVGQLVGVLLFPWIAEYRGRVQAIAWSSAVIGVASIACGFADGFQIFLILRVIQGLGLGGEMPVAATYINEISRARGRGRFVLLYEIIFPVGLLASSAIGAFLVPRYGWEVMYFIGGAPLILSMFLVKFVPESPRWLADQSRLCEADAALRRFEVSATQTLPPINPATYETAASHAHSKRRRRDLFSKAYLSRTLVVATLWATCGFLQYGLQAWLPTIYRNVYHAPLQLALNLAVGASVLAVLGSLVCALQVDRIGRKPMIVISFALCTVSLFLAGAFHTQSVYVVATFCALALCFLACGFITAYVYTPELYPTSIRAFGCGVGGAWLKLAAIVAPGLVSKTMIGGRLDLAFYILAAVPMLSALTVAYFGIETKEKVLEELEV